MSWQSFRCICTLPASRRLSKTAAIFIAWEAGGASRIGAARYSITDVGLCNVPLGVPTKPARVTFCCQRGHSTVQLRWNSSCFSLLKPQTGTIPPQLRFDVRKLRPSFVLQGGTQFPIGPRLGKRIPFRAGIPGCIFRKRPVWETVSRSELKFWVAVSPRGPVGKLHPGSSFNSGTRFPRGPPGEIESQNPSAGPLWCKVTCPLCTNLLIERRCVFALSCMGAIG